MSDRDEDTGILALRHQITVFERQLGTPGHGFRPATERSTRHYCTGSGRQALSAYTAGAPTPEIKTWLVRHPRVHPHFTPTGSSWFNLVVCWFAEPTNLKLRRGIHCGVAGLRPALVYRRWW